MMAPACLAGRPAGCCAGGRPQPDTVRVLAGSKKCVTVNYVLGAEEPHRRRLPGAKYWTPKPRTASKLQLHARHGRPRPTRFRDQNSDATPREWICDFSFSGLLNLRS